MEATHVGAEPQATSATDPAPVAPGGVPLGGDPLAPPAEAAPAEQPPVGGAPATSGSPAEAPGVDPWDAPPRFSEGSPEDVAADHQPGGDPADWSPATKAWMDSGEDVAGEVPWSARTSPVTIDSTHPAPATMMTADGLRQHGEITPGLGNAPVGDTTDLAEERPNTTGLVEPEQIETERPDIGTPGV